MQIRPTAFTIGLIIYSFIALFFVYTEFGIDSAYRLGLKMLIIQRIIGDNNLKALIRSALTN